MQDRCRWFPSRNSRLSLVFPSSVFLLLSLFILSPSSSEEDLDRKAGIGERFHHETSLTWLGLATDFLHAKPKEPPLYKRLQGAERMKLPAPKHQGLSVEEAIRKRRSLRNFDSNPMTLAQLSELLFAA